MLFNDAFYICFGDGTVGAGFRVDDDQRQGIHPSAIGELVKRDFVCQTKSRQFFLKTAEHPGCALSQAFGVHGY